MAGPVWFGGFDGGLGSFDSGLVLFEVFWGGLSL